MELRAFLSWTVQPKTEAGRINPTIHHLGQFTQALRLAQTASQLVQRLKITAALKTVAFLDLANGLVPGLTFNPLMAIEADLHPKGGMPAHFDRQVPPDPVQNVKMVMLDQWPGRLAPQDQFPLPISPGFPDQRRGASHQDGKDALEGGILGQEFLGSLVLGLVTQQTVDDGDVRFLGEGMKPTTEVARHRLQLLLVQGRPGAELVPPGQKTATGLAHEKVAVEDDTIDAIIAAIQQIGDIRREIVRQVHGQEYTFTRKPCERLFAEGEPLFPSEVWEKACSAIGKIVRKLRRFPISRANNRIMAGQNHAEQRWYDCWRDHQARSRMIRQI